MVRDSVELGRSYFCREETSGEGYSGLFQIGDEEIWAKLFSFDQPFCVDAKDHLILRLEDNRFVSLHDNISMPGECAYDLREPKRTAYAQRVVSNIAVIGRDAWMPTDGIKRVEFTIEYADDLLHHSDKFDAVADAEFGELPDTRIFELEITGLRISAWYTARGSMYFKRAQAIRVRYSIEFDKAASLRTYLKPVRSLLAFVSAALGHRFTPSKIEISRLSQAGTIKAMEANTYPGEHAVHYKWPVAVPGSGTWVGHAFVHARDDHELKGLIECLKIWLERDPEWQAATSLMMGALSRSGEMTGERLLNACRWLEEIPGAASVVAVDQEDINAIASCAAAEAERLGHEGYKERIAGVIRGQLKNESNAERFSRLKSEVCARFGAKAFDNAAVGHVLNAMQFRGKVAHGHFELSDDGEYKAFAKAVHALEALCYLLMLKDLPMTEAGRKRALGIEIASDYRHC
jgi:hypothetical protein